MKNKTIKDESLFGVLFGWMFYLIMGAGSFLILLIAAVAIFSMPSYFDRTVTMLVLLSIICVYYTRISVPIGKIRLVYDTRSKRIVRVLNAGSHWIKPFYEGILEIDNDTEISNKYHECIFPSIKSQEGGFELNITLNLVMADAVSFFNEQLADKCLTFPVVIGHKGWDDFLEMKSREIAKLTIRRIVSEAVVKMKRTLKVPFSEIQTSVIQEYIADGLDAEMTDPVINEAPEPVNHTNGTTEKITRKRNRDVDISKRNYFRITTFSITSLHSKVNNEDQLIQRHSFMNQDSISTLLSMQEQIRVLNEKLSHTKKILSK